MSGAVVAIHSNERETPRIVGLDKGLREAVADLLRRRFPTNTAKQAARTFDLSLDRAREAVAGRASLTTTEAIIKQGGLPVALSLMEEVVGKTFAEHIREVRRDHEEQARRIDALFGHWMPLAADRPAGYTDAARPLDSSAGSEPHRATGRRG